MKKISLENANSFTGRVISKIYKHYWFLIFANFFASTFIFYSKYYYRFVNWKTWKRYNAKIEIERDRIYGGNQNDQIDDKGNYFWRE